MDANNAMRETISINHDIMLKQLLDKDSRMNDVEAKCLSVVNWRDVDALAQFTKVDKFLANWED